MALQGATRIAVMLCLILLLMMATAFMGYVLPWVRMSFWGATVITNLFSAIPLVGENIVIWLWVVSLITHIEQILALHYLLPFVIVGWLYCILLPCIVSALTTCSALIPEPQDVLPFHPYYTIKDFFGLSVFLTFFAACSVPNMMGHPDNYIPANGFRHLRILCWNGTSCHSTPSCGCA